MKHTLTLIMKHNLKLLIALLLAPLALLLAPLALPEFLSHRRYRA